MNLKVKDFPIFHRYLASILLKVKLAEGTFSHIFNLVGEYTFIDYCHCGDPLCATVEISSESLIGKDGAYLNAFNLGLVIINFYSDGVMRVESLADREDVNFPFKQEIRDVFDGKKIGYGHDDAVTIVEDFMITFKKQEVKRIEV